jgi:hypothetical protein
LDETFEQLLIFIVHKHPLNTIYRADGYGVRFAVKRKFTEDVSEAIVEHSSETLIVLFAVSAGAYAGTYQDERCVLHAGQLGGTSGLPTYSP